MFKDAKLKLTMLTGGRWKFKLKNGLDATLYGLGNKKMETIALACEKPILPKQLCCAIPQKERKMHHVVELNILGEAVCLVYFCGTPPSRICADLQHDEKFEEVFLVVHQNQADYFSNHKARLIFEAIRIKTPPSVYALMNTTQTEN